MRSYNCLKRDIRPIREWAEERGEMRRRELCRKSQRDRNPDRHGPEAIGMRMDQQRYIARLRSQDPGIEGSGRYAD